MPEEDEVRKRLQGRADRVNDADAIRSIDWAETMLEKLKNKKPNNKKPDDDGSSGNKTKGPEL